MSAAREGRQVRVRGFAVALCLLATLHLTVLAASARERTALPTAGAALRAAVAAGAELLSCFEGVQDDVFGGLAAGTESTPASRALAAKTLRSCDVNDFDAHVEAVDLPPAPPIGDPERRLVRDAVEAGREQLERAVLDARATWTAMDADLKAGAVRSPEVTTGLCCV